MTAFVLAAHSDSQGGLDWIWIVVVLVLVVLGAIALMSFLAKTTSKSRGGVEHREERRRGDPPFESIDR